MTLRAASLLLLFAVPPLIQIQPAVTTETLPADPDDPAVWVHPNDAAQSLVIATIKAAAPAGGLAVFSLDGKLLQTVGPLNRPNNVDVEQNVDGIDLAIATERFNNRLIAFRIDPASRRLSEAGTLPVFEAPMGIGLYRRPKDGAVFAIVSRKSGPSGSYLWQYRLHVRDGQIRGEKVREFGAFSGTGEIEAVAVDDELGYVYYADEDFGIRQYHADPDHPDAGRELLVFAQDGFQGNREGIAIYRQRNGAGFIVCTDQIPGGSRYRLYDRRNPRRLVAVLHGPADSTDGIEVASGAFGSRFPRGFLVAMNSGPRNFLLFDWAALRLPRR
jgi:3-phytase